MSLRRIYVAHPIGANDEHRSRKIAAALEATRALLVAGFAPWTPGMFAASFGNSAADWLLSYEQWCALDMEFLEVCHAVLRLPGESPGAEREVSRARALGLPVFHTVEEVIAWVEAEDITRADAAGERVVAVPARKIAGGGGEA